MQPGCKRPGKRFQSWLADNAWTTSANTASCWKMATPGSAASRPGRDEAYAAASPEAASLTGYWFWSDLACGVSAQSDGQAVGLIGMAGLAYGVRTPFIGILKCIGQSGTAGRTHTDPHAGRRLAALIQQSPDPLRRGFCHRHVLHVRQPLPYSRSHSCRSFPCSRGSPP